VTSLQIPKNQSLIAPEHPSPVPAAFGILFADRLTGWHPPPQKKNTGQRQKSLAGVLYK
jgi:hypothetical protein